MRLSKLSVDSLQLTVKAVAELRQLFLGKNPTEISQIYGFFKDLARFCRISQVVAVSFLTRKKPKNRFSG